MGPDGITSAITSNRGFWLQPEKPELIQKIEQLLRDSEELKSLKATIAVHFGPEGRNHSGITIDTTKRLSSQFIQICQAYDKKLDAIVTADAGK